MRKLIYALALAVPVIFSSCSKDGDGPSSGSASAILTSGKWQLYSAESVYTIPGTGTVTEDLMKDLQTCEADNYGIFKADGTSITDEGATKCDPSDPQTRAEGTWELLDNNTKLKASDPVSGISVTADILQLDDNFLKIRYTTNFGVTAVTTEVVKHIK